MEIVAKTRDGKRTMLQKHNLHYHWLSVTAGHEVARCFGFQYWEQIIKVECIINQSVNPNGIVNVGPFGENVRTRVKQHVRLSCLLFLEHTSRDHYKDMNSPFKGKRSGCRRLTSLFNDSSIQHLPVQEKIYPWLHLSPFLYIVSFSFSFYFQVLNSHSASFHSGV